MMSEGEKAEGKGDCESIAKITARVRCADQTTAAVGRVKTEMMGPAGRRNDYRRAWMCKRNIGIGGRRRGSSRRMSGSGRMQGVGRCVIYFDLVVRPIFLLHMGCEKWNEAPDLFSYSNGQEEWGGATYYMAIPIMIMGSWD